MSSVEQSPPTQDTLVQDQYRTTSNLEARMSLHARFSTNTYGWHRWLFEQIDLAPSASVLELGCGSGELWAQNVDRLSDGWNTVLTDISGNMVRKCERRLRDVAAQFTFTLADAQAIPFQSAIFDVVIANHMLYHVPDKRRTLGQVRRVLKPNGHLYAATNGANHMRELREWLTSSAEPGENSSSADMHRAATSFLLEDGVKQLREWFDKVDLVRYEDSLVVTEVESILAYAFSMQSGAHIGEQHAQRLREQANQVIAKEGAFCITKDSGWLTASCGKIG